MYPYVVIIIGLIVSGMFYIMIKLRRMDEQLSFKHIKDYTQDKFSSLEAKLDRLGNEVFSHIGGLSEQSKLAIEERFHRLRDIISDNLFQGRRELNTTLRDVVTRLEEKFEGLRLSNEESLSQIKKNIESRLSETIDRNIGAIKQMGEHIGSLKESAVRIMDLTQGVTKLTSILGSPKLRGGFGEFSLAQMLKEFIPQSNYKLQAAIGNNQADALIILQEGSFCIDSKFPLENYRRLKEPDIGKEEKGRLLRNFQNDVRLHINKIAQDYIIPGKTLDFAFMYIPAEGIYYEILINPNLLDYSFSKKVIIVSPNSLYAYFQIIALGFRRMKIYKEAKIIEQTLLGIRKYFSQVKENLRILGNHLDFAQKRYQATSLDLQKVDTTLSGIGSGTKEIED